MQWYQFIICNSYDYGQSAYSYIINWFDRAEEAVKGVRNSMRNSERYNTEERKLSAIYQFALAMPLMFIKRVATRQCHYYKLE